MAHDVVNDRASNVDIGRVIAAVGAVFIYSNLETMLAPALPAMQADLHVSPQQLAWAISALQAAGCVTAPLIGRIADIHDRWRVFTAVMAVMGLGMAVSALAPSFAWLVVGQILQGVGMSLFALALVVCRDSLPPARRPMGNGLVVMAATVSTVVGLLVSGPLLGLASYRWFYWGSLSPLLVLVAIGFTGRHPVAPRAPAARQPLDLLGASLMAAWLLLLLGVLTIAPSAGFGSPLGLSLCALFAAAVLGWVYVELKTPSPLVDLRLMRSGPLLACSGIALLQGCATMGGFVAVPLLVRSHHGVAAAASASGLYLLPMGLGGGVTAMLVAPLRRRVGSAGVLGIGLTLIALGLAFIGLTGGGGAYIAAGMGITGAGIGFALSELLNVVGEQAPPDRVASASNLMMVLKTLGSAIGAQGAGSLIGALGARPDHGLRLVFLAAAGVAALALLLSLSLRARRGPAQTSNEIAR